MLFAFVGRDVCAQDLRGRQGAHYSLVSSHLVAKCVSCYKMPQSYDEMFFVVTKCVIIAKNLGIALMHCLKHVSSSISLNSITINFNYLTATIIIIIIIIFIT